MSSEEIVNKDRDEAYFKVLRSVVEGVPWTEQSAAASGFERVESARERTLGSAHCDDEDKWHELNDVFEQAVAETIDAWGKADFRGRGAASGYEYFKRHPDNRVERLAIWNRPGCIAYISLELADATRYRFVLCGEKSVGELSLKCNPWD